MRYRGHEAMWKGMLLALSFACLFAADAAKTFEVRGELSPRGAAEVSLHAVASPFLTSTLAGVDGRFRFRNVEPGLYTVSVSIPHRGEIRATISVGPGSADKNRRVAVRIQTDADGLNREAAAKVSARELKISRRARKELEDARARVARRDYEGATAALQRAVEMEPRFAAAWNHLGTIAYQTRRYSEAEGYFRKAVEADADAYEPRVNLGGVLINLGKLDDAKAWNLDAVLQRPDDALAQSQLGMTYLMLDRLDLAEKHLHLARKLDPAHFSGPQLHLAEVYYRRKDLPRAADQLEEFLRHRPDWPAADAIRAKIAEWRR